MDRLKSWLRSIDQSGGWLASRLIEFAEPRLTLLAAAAVIIVILISIFAGNSHEAVRNVGLIVGAIIALPIAIWRSRVAEQQVNVAQQQADIARQGVLNERYQKSAEMLGSEVLSVRLGGIAALEHLALEHPAQYHAEVMKLLFAFIRQPIEDPQTRDVLILDTRGGRQDVQAAVDAVRTCRSQNSAAEANSIRLLDLRGADLRQADLTNLDLSVVPPTEFHRIVGGSFGVPTKGAVLSHADLSQARLSLVKMPCCLCDGTNFTSADLIGAELREATFLQADLRSASLAAADLAGAKFIHSNLRNVWLKETNLSGVEFSETSPGATGLTQEQLDEACADPDVPPQVGNVFDVATGERLEWRGKECEEVFKKLDLNPLLWSR